MVSKPGRCIILEQFLADGIHYMFGNPGTSEEGFLDALQNYPNLHYILTLQESVAVMMADGYARATQKPALVQLHSTPGLGNAIGALYQAKRGHSPLIVVGGDSGIKYQAMDAQMAGDLVAMAEPVTKWSTMVMEPSSLLRVLRRAVKVATTPPMGPVYVCLPLDILEAPAVEEVKPSTMLSTRVLPDEELLKTAAIMLASAHKPMIFVGDGIAFSEAQDELTHVAELLGAEVWEADAGELNISHTHPLYQGTTGHMFGYQSFPITSKGDVNLVCGTYLLPEVFPKLSNIFAPNAKVIHIDLDTEAIAKNHPVDLGMLGDPKCSLAKLATILDAILTPEQRSNAETRVMKMALEKSSKHESELKADQKVWHHTPLHFSRFAEALAEYLPEDAILFDEALTCSPSLTRYLPPTRPGHYFLTRGGSLGVGIPGAIGVKLAHPDKTVVAVTGDGGAMYTIQALWSAARHNVDAKFIICNNRSYRLLQLNILAYWQERSIPRHAFPLSFDLSQPILYFDQMARSMGVEGIRVEKPDEIVPTIQKALAYEGPFLIDVVLEGDVCPDMIGIKCGQ
ncbi:MAG: thiamine pyrophosphate-binding protein [Synechococcales cyanobacterium C42_A2020_086]|jgi:benzoylformate decarboxylase|nr:thiamine pyrophosphate-binding protein [Synechococcales cyanobacterium C42_A2020_086]